MVGSQCARSNANRTCERLTERARDPDLRIPDAGEKPDAHAARQVQRTSLCRSHGTGLLHEAQKCEPMLAVSAEPVAAGAGSRIVRTSCLYGHPSGVSAGRAK